MTEEIEACYRVAAAVAWPLAMSRAAVHNMFDFIGGDLPYDHALGQVETTFFLGFVREQEAGSSYHPMTEEASECP